MSGDPNHEYEYPKQGDQNWGQTLNEQVFAQMDIDIELRGEGAPGQELDPREGAKYLDTTTGEVYRGDGTTWTVAFAVGRLDGESLQFPEGVSINGDLEASGTKHFVQTVETSSGPCEVVYTSTEAPTPRTEASGVAQLTDGRAVVDLPEHFAWVTSETAPLLVQATPYAVGSAGLAAVERSTSRLVVEDRSGEGDYQFAYTVRGTRRGHEDTEVVRRSREQSGDCPPVTTDDD